MIFSDLKGSSVTTNLHLQHLIDEQLADKKCLYLTSFGTDIKPCWECVRTVNCRM